MLSMRHIWLALVFALCFGFAPTSLLGCGDEADADGSGVNGNGANGNDGNGGNGSNEACPPACQSLAACGAGPDGDATKCGTFCLAFDISFSQPTVGECARATYIPWFECVNAASGCDEVLACEANPNIPECQG